MTDWLSNDTSSRVLRFVRTGYVQGFSGATFARVMGQLTQAEVEVICRQSARFEILPERWFVERTFAW